MVEAVGCQDDDEEDEDVDDDDEDEDDDDEDDDEDLVDDLASLLDGGCLVSTRGGGGLTGLLVGSSLDQSSRDWFLGGGGGLPGLTAACDPVDNGDRVALAASLLRPQESG